MWFLQVGRCPQSKLKAAGKIMLYLPQNRPGNRKPSTVKYWIQNKSSYHRYNFNLVFYTGKFCLPPPFFFLNLANYFFPEFKDPCYFYHAAVPALWEITHRTAKDTSSLLSFSPVLGHVCLLSCQWHSYFCDCHAQSRCYQSKLFLHVL